MAQSDSSGKTDFQLKVEELNLAVMLLEPDDAAQRAQLKAQVDTLGSSVEGSIAADAQSILLSMGQLLAGPAADATKVLDALQNSLSMLTALIEGSKGAGAGTPGASFELPAWVDEELFGDFISGQRLAQDDLEAIVLRIERGEGDAPDEQAELKRRLHSLKGDAATVGMESLSGLYHELETLIDASPTPQAIVEPCLKALDWINEALESYSQLRHPETDVEDALEQMRQAAGGGGDSAAAPGTGAPAQEAQAAPEPEEDDHGASDESIPMEWDEETIELVAEFLMEADEGVDSADRILLESQNAQLVGEQVNALFRIFHTIKGVAGFLNLEGIGLLAHATESVLNKARDGEIELVGLPLNLVFEATEAMRDLLGGVREAAESMSDLPSAAHYNHLTRNLINLNDEAKPSGAAAESEPEPGASAQAAPAPAAASPAPAPTQAAAPAQTQAAPQAAAPAPAPAAPKPAAKPAGKAPTKAKTLATKNKRPPKTKSSGDKDGRSVQLREVVKVDLERVDGLVDLIGELVILESMVTNSLRLEKLTGRSVLSLMSQLNKTVRDLQSLGLALRMVPLRGAFQKMARLVRDVSLKSNKSARLVVSGEKTEMDRRLVESISDPLVHMVRNSVDHGLETPEERRRIGKPEQGTIRLSASHDGGNIVIEIADDGKGLNKEAILAKAEQKGLIPAGATLSDEETWQLIFSPGFSTAAQVTEISGRGVGMDVVKRNIESLRGRITIESTAGEGTTFKLHLPLTLAIINGLLFAVGEERYILPTLSVVESFQPTPDLISSYGEGTELVNVRGEILPLIRLHEMLGVDSQVTKVEDGLLVIVQGTRIRGAMLVDNILGQQNIVIKTLGSDSGTSNTFSGAAILSDGRVGLILNVDEVLQGIGIERRLAEFSGPISDANGLPQAQA